MRRAHGLRRVLTRATLALVVAGLLAAVRATPAAARVSTAPAAWTPQVTSPDATVRKLLQCGPTVYAVGSFSQVTQGGHVYARHNAFSFSATTGALTSWAPDVNGTVDTVALTPGCHVVYLGGTFTLVGSTAVRDLAAVAAGTGAVLPAFAHNANGVVETLLLVHGGTELMVGGAFTSINGRAQAYLASVSPSTGAVDSYFTYVIAGHVAPKTTRTMVYNSQLSHDGSRMLIEGSWTTIGPYPRQQIAELDLGAHAIVSRFSNAALNTTGCTSVPFYLRAASYSPDDSVIYAATTGVRGTSPFCDALVAFANNATGTVRWINKTGTDSLYAVAAAQADVYVAGHERWADNPDGKDSCVATCVSRPGVGDISATSGRATVWNPTRDRGRGADDLLLTTAGLWVASDTYYNSVKCAGQYHPGICFFPGRG